MGKHSVKTTPPARLSPAGQNRKPQPRPAPKNNPAPARRPLLQWLGRALGLRSALVAALAALGIYVSITQNVGYQWTWSGYLKGNWDFIREHPHLTPEERLQAKLGFDYAFLNFVKQNTPDDAVILFPRQEHITEKVGNNQLTVNIASKMWVTHFVYPRRIVYRDEAETNPLYRDITHVAICAMHGYEDMDYEVNPQQPFAIFPRTMNE
ncbi:MAG: hypothetical protein LBJ23_06770 [Tannerella sp.]|jgi:hypothetical protein|nr:hypothetical protein [Tannerella sp.]